MTIVSKDDARDTTMATQTQTGMPNQTLVSSPDQYQGTARMSKSR